MAPIGAETGHEGPAKVLVLGGWTAEGIPGAAAGLDAELWIIDNVDELANYVDEGSWGCLVADPLALNEQDKIRLSTFVRDFPSFPLVVWSPSLERRSAVDAIRAGAFDALHNPEDDAQLPAALSDALRTGREKLEAWREHREVARRLENLQPKERKVLALVLQGRTNKEIATELDYSLRTVEARRQRILRTMQAENAIDLAVLLSRRGLIDEALEAPQEPKAPVTIPPHSASA